MSNLSRIQEGVRRVLRHDRKVALKKAITELEAEVAKSEQELEDARRKVHLTDAQQMLVGVESGKLALEEVRAMLKLYEDA